MLAIIGKVEPEALGPGNTAKLKSRVWSVSMAWMAELSK